METVTLEENGLEAGEIERPSEAFVRAVADLLETDANDILSELGYTYGGAPAKSHSAAEAF